MSLYQWLTNREYGNAPRIGDGNLILQRTYNSMKMFHVHEFNQKLEDSVGAVFNLEFNADGNVLVAACEKKAIVLFDVISRQQTCKIPNAHTDNVNCIKFLDDRLFASGSDDETVALWDLRYLKEKLRVLHGHSNWVKNIEYSSKDKLLVTSGFDGSIFTWDIQSQTEQGLISQRVFQTSGLMRCRISPDGEKLVFSTSGGYLMIIHHLDLSTLHKDLCGFRPSMYRLMQMGDQYIPQAAKYAHVFSKSQKKNRVEFVTDFPENDDAEMIGALQIHPQGHCILSRNTSCDEQSEWTCIHDVNEEPDDDSDNDTSEEPLSKKKRHSTNGSDDDSERAEDTENNDLLHNSRPNDFYRANRLLVFRNARNLGTRFALARTLPPLPPINSNQNGRPEAFIPDIWAAEVTVQERAVRQSRARNSTAVTGYNFVYAISSGVLPVRGQFQQNTERPIVRSHTESNSDAATSTDNEPLHQSDSSGSSTSSETPLPFERLHLRPIRLTQPKAASLQERSILKNAEKLMFYSKETNQDRGFIKEPCFSADGRIVCSPYGTGLRLLAYTKDCSEYPRYQMFDDVKRTPRELVEVAKITNHDEVVYCTKFSPREPLLVSGCQAGRVVWYHPNL